MSKKPQQSNIHKTSNRTRIASLIAFVLAVIGYWSAGYVNSNISTDKYPDAFFQTIYLGIALLSFVATGIIIYHSTRNMSWRERTAFIVLAGISLIVALENLFAGLMVGAFTNF